MEEMKMSLSSWRNSLHLLLNQSSAKQRIAIVGIGNTFRCDDAAGILVARHLKDSHILQDLKTVLVIDAGHAPENVTGELRRFKPDVILLIDAAEMGEFPGTIRWIEMDALDGLSASTHTMPLSMLAKYFSLELSCKIGLLGIQPKSNDVGEAISTEVSEAVEVVVKSLGEIVGGSPAV
jgi:hydrogenase 3 maturation protease